MKMVVWCLPILISVGKASDFVSRIKYSSGTHRALEGFCGEDSVGVDGVVAIQHPQNLHGMHR